MNQDEIQMCKAPHSNTNTQRQALILYILLNSTFYNTYETSKRKNISCHVATILYRIEIYNIDLIHYKIPTTKLVTNIYI